VRSGKSQKNYENEYKSSLGVCRQKLIGALNSAMNGEDGKPNKFNIFVPQKISEVWNELKNGENEYKSSMGGRRQKPIGALNLA
jgi:hypothetical protein